MHRRAILELSRRHGVEYAARPRPVFSPVLTTRRSFRTSLVTFNSPETSPDPTISNNEADSNSPKPKFGARWGSKLAQKPAALSPAEQALRDALVAKKTSDGSKPTSKSDSRGQNAPSRPQQKRHLPSAHPLRDKESQSLQPDKKFELNTNKVPTHLRNRDWICPDCQYHCFGKHKICPCCRAVRPDLNSPPPPPRRSHKKHESRHHSPQHAEETIKIRKLGKTMLSELQDESVESRGLSRRDNALRQHMASKGQYAGPRIVYDVEAEAERVEAEEAAREAEKRRRLHQHPKSKAKQTEETADPWTWDSSSLDAMKFSEESAQQKKLSKRRENRKRNEEEEEDEEAEERRRRREERKRQKKEKSRRKEVEVDSAPIPLYLPEFISVSNLADVIGVRPAQFVQRMEEMGFEDVTYNHILDAETAGLVATEFNFEPIFETGADDLKSAPEPEDKSIFPPRPPVVTIMGHVDHGKTTILDWLRKSSVAAGEHGGITQHIGAFSVAMPSGKTITFLDTPGHSAFLEMRRRGADVTDIVVLVVAADDSVKPQTIEAIKHATGANVPIIVAISKIDKENVNPEKVKQDLSVHGVHVEDYGGDVQAIGVSGKTGQGMLELEEAIVTLSEILDHRADTGGSAEGWVIEGTTKSYGRVATALVRRGTLRPGDIVVAGTTWARIRTLRNEAGVAVDEATPGMPVEIDGWREQPSAGSEILQAVDEQQAKEVVEYRLEKSETQKLGQDTAAINEARREVLEKRRQEDDSEDGQTADAAQETSGPKPIHFIIKADVGGSAEAVLNSVTAIGNNEVFANVLRSGVGPVGEFDIEHAATANGHIISFNMPIDPAMHRMAENRGVKIMDHNIIYKLIDDVKATLSEHLAPLVSQRVTGEAEIGQIFEITLKGREKTAIAGCRVRNGVINRTKKVRVLRGQETIFDGSMSSLKNVKKDVTEMRKDTECGIAFENWTDFAVGDHIQCYEEIHEKRYL
ncbi:hypothetical protein ATEG_02971 [Aspergillus terreus NIH2624]|uniref:Translation initiation factor IF-2, mitochondrial n=1 Tax=Aspergillus terreus (strain NIH 2624 / FGSC A1156) TaxID=341663 RepID=Q0CTL3_ASPTN|nr:uncharacterized protein ATEG_02971 [Aspergillus terreus NIH2624]EAU36245.1 hypothetical protein ATEG_02971 [Aspergillus terreus NIH2624]